MTLAEGDKLMQVERLAKLDIFPLETNPDLLALVDLEAKAFGGVGEDIFTLATVAKIGSIHGIKDMGKLVGAIEFLQQEKPHHGFIHGVVVDPSEQYSGLGTRLIKHAEKEAVEKGNHVMECTISPTNGASLRAFVNHCGYRGVKFIPDCYGPGEHRLWITRDLTQNPVHFNYHEKVQAQQDGEYVVFVQEDDFKAISDLFDSNMTMTGVIKASECGNCKNLLCFEASE
jgi:ribosomal protein S18 acetylase RimI-like enzyme